MLILPLPHFKGYQIEVANSSVLTTIFQNHAVISKHVPTKHLVELLNQYSPVRARSSICHAGKDATQSSRTDLCRLRNSWSVEVLFCLAHRFDIRCISLVNLLTREQRRGAGGTSSLNKPMRSKCSL